MKPLLSVEEAAAMIGCTLKALRRRVIEHRALKAILVSPEGYRSPFIMGNLPETRYIVSDDGVVVSYVDHTPLGNLRFEYHEVISYLSARVRAERNRVSIDELLGRNTSSDTAIGAESATEPKLNWRMAIQAEAYDLWLRLRASGCNPSVYSISPDMAEWCIKNDIRGGKGQNPTAGTIRNAVLGGSSGWTPPTHSVAQAKKAVAQIAQTAQTKVARKKK